MKSAYFFPDLLCSVAISNPRILIMRANSSRCKTVNPAYSIQYWMRLESMLKPNASKGRVWMIRTALGNIPTKCRLPNKSTPPLQDSSNILYILLGESSALLPKCGRLFLDKRWSDLVIDVLDVSPQNRHSLVGLCCGYNTFLFGSNYEDRGRQARNAYYCDLTILLQRSAERNTRLSLKGVFEGISDEGHSHWGSAMVSKLHATQRATAYFTRDHQFGTSISDAHNWHCRSCFVWAAHQVCLNAKHFFVFDLE